MMKNICFGLLTLVGFGFANPSTTLLEECAKGVSDGSTICIETTLRDFQIWNNPDSGFIRHSDFENFAILDIEEYSRGCGGDVVTNRDYLEGIAVLKEDLEKAFWAQDLLSSNADSLDLPLYYGEHVNGERGYAIDLNHRLGGSFKWYQRVQATKGMVANKLDENGKPVKIANKCDNENFDQWFNTVPGVNFEINSLMPLSKVDERVISPMYQISSNAYFPLDEYHGSDDVANWGKQAYSMWCGYGNDEDFDKCQEMNTGEDFDANDSLAHNYGYTIEGELEFTYHGGEYFTFTGDDDMWVFIDGELVIDLGGIHLPGTKTINLDNLAEAKGWTLHTDHTLKFFHADRQTDGSNFEINFSINDVVHSEELPPLITRSYTEAGKFNSFLIFVNTPLSTETLAAVNEGLLPDLIKNNSTYQTVVEQIQSIEIADAPIQYGYGYEILVSEGRPSMTDSISFNIDNLNGIEIMGENGRLAKVAYKTEVEFAYLPPSVIVCDFGLMEKTQSISFEKFQSELSLFPNIKYQIFNQLGEEMKLNSVNDLESGLYFIRYLENGTSTDFRLYKY